MNGITAATEVDRHAIPDIDAIDWSSVAVDLDLQGWAILPNLLTTTACTAVARLYADNEGFRSRVVMARHGFGRGEYRYFAYPLPTVVPLQTGEAVVFAVNQRPVQGSRGNYRVTLRHGVSKVRAGHRHTLGIIFHDAT